MALTFEPQVGGAGERSMRFGVRRQEAIGIDAVADALEQHESRAGCEPAWKKTWTPIRGPIRERRLTVLREKSFDGAARSLGLTPSAISQRIKKLEERVGAIVVTRSSPLAPTSVGLRLCQHVEKVRLMEMSVLTAPGAALGDAAPLVSIKIVVDEASRCGWFLDALADAANADGRLFFEIAVVQPVNLLGAMRSGGAFGALTYQNTAVNGFKSVRLCTDTFRAIASPDFMNRYFPHGVTGELLASAPVLKQSAQDDLHARWAEQVFGANLGARCHALPSADDCLAACRRGIAWTLCHSAIADDLLRRGELVELVPGSGTVRDLHWQYSLIADDILSGFTESLRTFAAIRPEHGRDLGQPLLSAGALLLERRDRAPQADPIAVK